MTFYQQNIHFAIGRHKDAVRVGERRALRLARVAPQAKASGGLGRRAVGWLARCRPSLGHARLPSMRVARGKQTSG